MVMVMGKLKGSRFAMDFLTVRQRGKQRGKHSVRGLHLVRPKVNLKGKRFAMERRLVRQRVMLKEKHSWTVIHWDWLKETPRVKLMVIDLGLSRGLRLD